MSENEPLSTVVEQVPLLMVSRIQASVEFYEQQLGFRRTTTWEPEGQLRWCRLELHRVAIMLQQAGAGVPVSGATGVTLYFNCLDAQAVHAQLTANGLSLAPPEVAFYGMLQVELTDPDGYQLVFQSPCERPVTADQPTIRDAPPVEPLSGLTLVAEPTDDEMEQVDQELSHENKRRTGRDDFRPLRRTIRDADGRLVGGIDALTVYDWMYVKTLWVAEEYRQAGLGTWLLREAETEARSRGCLGACLSTFSFQAPEFYEKQGYRQFGQIPHYPHGETFFVYSKRLSFR